MSTSQGTTMLMENDRTFGRTSRPGACTMSRGEAWKTCGDLGLEATRLYAAMFATSGVYMINYSICLASCTTALYNCAFTFGRQIRRSNTPYDFLQQSNSYTEDCSNAFHRYNEKLTHLTKKATDDIVKPVKVNTILAYAVIR